MKNITRQGKREAEMTIRLIRSLYFVDTRSLVSEDDIKTVASGVKVLVMLLFACSAASGAKVS